jgi:serine/threonine protein kinase/tetratricopeptide (TPR) repeat protein
MISALSSVHVQTLVPDFSHESLQPISSQATLRTPADIESTCAVATPSSIGQYRILATLGSGGMGVVYKAEQRHPVKRLVAVKLIKLGMDTRHVIARFESERQALALMDHPNVAKVLDAGATDAGRPYFVMDYVPGQAITEYCDKNRLTTDERLQLFMQVCDAVQHAHQKGIIHRDLKPGNVLVEYRDGKAVPKVIDFGIAKATSSALTGITLYTEHGQMIGTPEYVSPEQAETSGIDVDTRTDIYSLGVLLYELLTGTLPFDPKELRTAGYAAMQQIIRDQDPPKPSTKLTKSGTQIATIAKHRRTEPRALARQIRGEMDWIILKAMEKDRSRRYETAAALSMDIARYLRDDPVSAGPPTATYRVGKFVKRHIIGLAAGAAIAAALLVGLGLAVYGLYSARQQRDAAEVARADAERESRRSQQINDYLLRMLAAVDPEQAKVMDISPDMVLQRSRELFGDNKALLGAVLSSRASALRSAGQLDDAERAYSDALSAHRAAHGLDHPTVAATLAGIAQVHVDRGDFPAAARSFRDALQIKRKAFGPKSKPVADALATLTGAMVANSSRTPEETTDLKRLLIEQIEVTQAAYGPEDRKTVEILCIVGIRLYQNRFLDEAQPVLERAVELGRKTMESKNEVLIGAMNALTKIYVERNNVAAAKPLYAELNKSIQMMMGSGNPIAVNTTLGLAAWLVQVRDTEAAESVLRTAITAASATAPRGDLILTEAKQSLLKIMLTQKKPDREFIRGFWLEYLDDRRVQYGASSPKLAPLLVSAASQFSEWSFSREAEDLYRQAVPLLRAADPIDQSVLSDALLGYGSVLVINGRATQAEPVLREALAIRESIERPGHWSIAQARCALGESLLARGDVEGAAPILEEAADIIDAARQAPPDAKRRALEALSRLYALQGKPEQARQLQEKLSATSQPLDNDDPVR